MNAKPEIERLDAHSLTKFLKPATFESSPNRTSEVYLPHLTKI